jgi:hypothetical protein
MAGRLMALAAQRPPAPASPCPQWRAFAVTSALLECLPVPAVQVAAEALLTP